MCRQQAQGLPNIRQKLQSCRVERHPLCIANKEGDTILLLQLLDLTAYGPLCAMQSDSRLTQATELCNSQKCLQAVYGGQRVKQC